MIRATRVAKNHALPMPTPEELASFLAEARRMTARRDVTSSLWVEWRKTPYSPVASNLHYTTQSIGYRGMTEHELVSLGGTPIWASSSLGGITDLSSLPEANVVRAFLKGRHRRFHAEGAWPRDGHRFDAFRYVYQDHGTLAVGYGEEQLFHDCYLVYHTYFRHGLIR